MRMNPVSWTIPWPKAAPLQAALLALALAPAATAQQPMLNSHEVNADGSVTLRLYAPTATKVTVQWDYDHAHLVALAKGADGVWTTTSSPLQPALHAYALEVDGTPVLDPLNSAVDPSYVFQENEVTVPGPPQPWDVGGVPHGVVHHHAYVSASITGLPDGIEDYYVYTPPGYDAAGGKAYPVLYLLHGWSAESNSWTHSGKANFILDNLIAQGKAVPMIIVMPLCYGDIGFVTHGFDVWSDMAKVSNNLRRFSDALLTEIKPQVESAYRVSARRGDRAIAGLSMGGLESLAMGLNHPDMFGWVGGFSPAVVDDHYDNTFPALDPKAAPRLLWIACGTSDDLIKPFRNFATWLGTRGMHATVVETAGIHNWPVWRDDLVKFAPLLFRDGAPGP
jgi:enterochelin esterase-like enzyme